MKLFASTTSPFSRLVLVACYRAHIDAEVVFVLPWENPPELLAVNPFCQVPALLTDNQVVITESSVILAHLLPELIKDENTASMLSLSLGIINQAVRAFATQRFQPEHGVPHPFIKRSTDILKVILPTVPNLEPESNDWGQIFLGMALAYVQLRLPAVFKASVSTANQQAIAAFSQRDFFQKTTASYLERLPKSIADL